MSDDLVHQLKELGVAERTAKYALDVSLYSDGAPDIITEDNVLTLQRFNGDLTKAADYGECERRKLGREGVQHGTILIVKHPLCDPITQPHVQPVRVCPYCIMGVEPSSSSSPPPPPFVFSHPFFLFHAVLRPFIDIRNSSLLRIWSLETRQEFYR